MNTPKDVSDVALIILGHGSHFNPNSSVPVRRIAARIRRSGEFGQVQAAFWKEQPEWHQVLAETAMRRVVVVPYFMSAGYFADRVAPRELGLGEVDFGETVELGDRCVTYGAPVGTHPQMTEILRARVEAICGPPSTSPNPAETTVVLVGHGTPEHDESATSTSRHVERSLRDTGFARVCGSFLDEEPQLSDVLDTVATPNLVVVPYFTANGLHSQEDIPEILGLAEDWSEGEPQATTGRCGEAGLVWYGSAVGTDPSMIRVVRARAAEAIERTTQSREGGVYP